MGVDAQPEGTERTIRPSSRGRGAFAGVSPSVAPTPPSHPCDRRDHVPGKTGAPGLRHEVARCE